LAPEKIASLKVEENSSPAHNRRILREAPEGQSAVVTPKSAWGTKSKAKGSSKIKKEPGFDEDDTEPEFEDQDDADRYYVTPRSSTKRKVRRPNYADDDAESSDGDGSYHPSMETPTKKTRTSTRRRPAIDGPASGGSSRPVSGSSSEPIVLEPTPSVLSHQAGPSFMGYASNGSSPGVALGFSHHGFPVQSAGPLFASHDGLPQLGQQFNALSPSNIYGQSPTYDPEAESRNMDVSMKDRYDAYRDTICDILNISREDGKEFSLMHLRRYARGYNNTYGSNVYTDPETPGWSFQGQKAFRTGHTIVDHFALVNPRMMDIAKLRGDVDNGGRYNPFSANAAGFHAFLNAGHNQALGAVDNEFGVPHHLYAVPTPPFAPAYASWAPAHRDGFGDLFSNNPL
jgi:hypothetical protein